MPVVEGRNEKAASRVHGFSRSFHRTGFSINACLGRAGSLLGLAANILHPGRFIANCEQQDLSDPDRIKADIWCDRSATTVALFWSGKLSPQTLGDSIRLAWLLEALDCNIFASV